jgi:hypothetical protein
MVVRRGELGMCARMMTTLVDVGSIREPSFGSGFNAGLKF